MGISCLGYDPHVKPCGDGTSGACACGSLLLAPLSEALPLVVAFGMQSVWSWYFSKLTGASKT
jgi:hypothetical protein